MPTASRIKTKSPGRCRGSKAVLLFLLLASLRRSLGGLGRRVHCRFIGAHILEQDRAIRQVGLAQAGARRRYRASHDRRSRDRVVATTDDVDRPTAEAVPREPPAEGRTGDRATQPRMTPATKPVVVVVADVDAVAEVRDMPAVTVARMTDDTRMTNDARMTTHPGTATADDATAVTMAAGAATMRTRIGSGGDESRQADDKRRGEGEECSTFEHCETFWLVVNHPCQ
jgi:hypothetical protein